MMLSIMSIPLQTKSLEPNTKLRHSREAKNTEFIHDNLQGWTCQLMSFTIWWRFEVVINMELFAHCHYYSRVVGGGCFHDLIDNTLVSHVKWLITWTISHRVFMNTKMYTSPQHLKAYIVGIYYESVAQRNIHWCATTYLTFQSWYFLE